MTRRLGVACLLLLSGLAMTRAHAEDGPPNLAPAPAPSPAPEPPSIASIEVFPGDVFTKEDERANPFWVLANLIHIATRPHVIRRELLFAEGDVYRPEVVQETERNLRDLRYISQADIEVRPRDDGDVDIAVRTRDKFSLAVGAGVGLVGGVSKGSVQVSESNLLGLGKRVAFNYVQRTDRTIVRGTYDDPNVLGTRHTLLVFASASDLGSLYTATFAHPFYSLETPYAYDVFGSLEDSAVEYFEEGEVVSEVPQEVRILSLSGAVGFGPRTAVRRLGLRLTIDEKIFDPPEGEEPLRVRRPLDRDTQTLALEPSLIVFHRFDKLRDLDAYDLVEDVPVGFEGRLFAGPQRRRDARGARAELVAGGSLTWVARPRGLEVSVVAIAGSLRQDDRKTQAYDLQGFWHFYRRFEGHTLALNVSGRAIEELEDLEPQLTLGEDSGLRGFEARLFEGTRILRANVEDRIFTPFELLSFHLGLVAFVDAGIVWDHDRAPRLRDVEASAGIGFRLFSPELLKRVPVRVDLAFPLTGGAERSFSVSVSAGQVFSLFENEAELEARF